MMTESTRGLGDSIAVKVYIWPSEHSQKGHRATQKYH